MSLPPLIRPQVSVHPTLDSATWFLQLRWFAVAGQLLTLAAVYWGLRINLPVSGLLLLIGVTGLTNSGYQLWLRRLNRDGLQPADRLPSDHVVSCLMLVDIVVLTGMLYLSAGIANPFALFYFVNIAVAGAIITPTWAWGVWAATVAGVCLLLIDSQPIEELSSTSTFATAVDDSQTWTIPKAGYMVAFTTCSGVITYFITILTGELRQREMALKEAENARIRNRQLEGLATLAGGAAHELATPLSTIAVVAKELGRSLEKQQVPESLRTDVTLIRSELDRCRQILDRMTSAAGEAAGERLREVTINEFVEECLIGLRQPERVEVTIADSPHQLVNLLPVQATAQAIRNLIQNALDASPAEFTIELEATCQPQQWVICVRDQGAGMAPDVLQRIGEPFFTTKEPGRGMGLGLYLTQNVVRRLNGKINFTSTVGKGTEAVVVLPTNRQ